MIYLGILQEAFLQHAGIDTRVGFSRYTMANSKSTWRDVVKSYNLRCPYENTKEYISPQRLSSCVNRKRLATELNFDGIREVAGEFLETLKRNSIQDDLWQLDKDLRSFLKTHHQTKYRYKCFNTIHERSIIIQEVKKQMMMIFFSRAFQRKMGFIVQLKEETLKIITEYASDNNFEITDVLSDAADAFAENNHES